MAFIGQNAVWSAEAVSAQNERVSGIHGVGAGHAWLVYLYAVANILEGKNFNDQYWSWRHSFSGVKKLRSLKALGRLIEGNGCWSSEREDPFWYIRTTFPRSAYISTLKMEAKHLRNDSSVLHDCSASPAREHHITQTGKSSVIQFLLRFIWTLNHYTLWYIEGIAQDEVKVQE